MTTATATKTLLENITSFYLCYFMIISTHLTCTKTANYPGTKLAGAAYFELRKRMKNSPLSVHVLHRTLNLVISRCCFAGQQRNVQKFKMHVQRDCFCSLNLLF